MKKQKRRRTSEAPPITAEATPRSFVWWPWAAALAGLFVIFEVYGPALRGPFLFDDRYLPFMSPSIAGQPLSEWVSGVRPLLMLSFWLDFQQSGTEPHIYHVTNVILHFLTSVLIA